MRIPTTLALALGVALAASAPASAHADDAGADASTADADVDATPEGIRPTEVPDNWGCAAAPASSHARSPLALAALVALALAVAARRRRGRAAAGVVAALALVAPSLARAEPPPSTAPAAAPEAPSSDPDALREVRPEEPPMRRLTISLAPLSPMIGRWGGALEVLLASHHALGLSGAWVHCHTNEDSNNVFSGGIGELGYRYYFGDNGARGFFLGPSFVFGAFSATPERGSSQSFYNLGGALDAGFSALAFDRVLFALGAGIQYTAPTATFPAQELPASIYARPGVRPRLLLAIGVAF